MLTSDITYTTRNNEAFTGYLSQPESTDKHPGIVIFTAIWGVDESMQELADAFAADGFIVSVPDYFWRQTPGPTADREVAFGRMQAYESQQGIMDVEDVINHLRNHPQCNGKVAVLGFCFGGWIAHISAARFGVDAAASYHGTRIGQYLEETSDIHCPVSHHFGDNDPAVPMEEVRRIQQAYSAHSNANIVVYPGAEHSFAIPGKPGYDAQLAMASRQAVLECFQSI